MLRFATDLPDTEIGVPPVGGGLLDLTEQDGPERLGELVTGLGVEVDGVQHGAPDVELPLVDSSVADSDGAGAVVAAEPLENDLGKVPFASDPVHDLQVVLGGDVADEGEEVVGFPV